MVRYAHCNSFRNCRSIILIPAHPNANITVKSNAGVIAEKQTTNQDKVNDTAKKQTPAKKKNVKKLSPWKCETGDTALNKTSGVNIFKGRKETYYSSKVLYHYKTPKWVLDDEGCWRTKSGYYVVASEDYPEGTIIKISKGLAKVLDCGCPKGVVDVYVNW